MGGIGRGGRGAFAKAFGLWRLQPGGGQTGGDADGQLIGDRIGGNLPDIGGLGGQGLDGLQVGEVAAVGGGAGLSANGGVAPGDGFGGR